MNADSNSDENKLTAELRLMGPRFDPQILMATRGLYREPVRALPWSDRVGLYDVVYGPEDRHRLDLYPTDRRNAPCMAFFHGGGFISGDKRGDSVFYGNVGRYFAAHGILTVVANYRLAPAATWPSGIEDVASVVAWTALHAADHGGDPNRIVLIGQSAGATHVAGYLFGSGGDGCDSTVRGAALMSGIYRLTAPLDQDSRLYFGDDEATQLMSRTTVTGH